MSDDTGPVEFGKKVFGQSGLLARLVSLSMVAAGCGDAPVPVDAAVDAGPSAEPCAEEGVIRCSADARSVQTCVSGFFEDWSSLAR